MTRNYRVAIFTETFLPRVDGIVNTLKWSLRGLVEAGWEPLVVAPAGNTQPLAGVRVLGSPSIVFPPYPEVRLGFPSPEVWRKLDAFRPDLVHLAGPVTNGFGGLKYAQVRGIPSVSSYHTALPEYAQLYGLSWMVELAWAALRTVHNDTACTLSPSRQTIADLQARGFEHLKLWSRGVDTQLFSPNARSPDMRARLGARPDELLAVYVGRLAREKKLERIAGALRKVAGVRLALVGDGPARRELQRDFDGLPVSFTGTLRGPELAAAYASADVFVFPSDTDTFGNVVLEAMASGLPVLACEVGGHLDLVESGVTGLLFSPLDDRQLASHLELYRDQPSLRERHGTAGLRAAAQRTWSRIVQQLIGHYEDAINARARERSVLTSAA